MPNGKGGREREGKRWERGEGAKEIEKDGRRERKRTREEGSKGGRKRGRERKG